MTPKQKKKKKNSNPTCNLFCGRNELGDGLGTLRDGVLGQLTGQDQTDRGLNFAGGDGGLLVVGSKLGSLSGNALEDIVDK